MFQLLVCGISKMASMLTITCTGTSSILHSRFFPEIFLDAESNYNCALLDLIINDCEVVDKIIKLGLIRIECDIVSHSYINGKQSHTIHQFATGTSYWKGNTFVEIPRNINYLPIKKTENLRSIQISIIDQSGKLVDINEGKITCRISIKKGSKDKSD